MEKRTERKSSPDITRPNPGRRTDRELAESIRRKRVQGLDIDPLDPEEAELVRKQNEEDTDERTGMYRTKH